MNIKYLKIKDRDPRSLIIFLICMVLVVGIPIYWFLLVPPALELQEINQDSFTASGYFAPGGYIDLNVNLGKESIQGYHNGGLNIIPNMTNAQNGTIWQPIEIRVDQWPGSKSEIKYSSNNPINQMMILNLKRIDIPNNSALKGQNVLLNIKYSVNYPFQTEITEVLGGTITNFELRNEIIEKNISLKLTNQVITQEDLEAISMNETWKKILSLIIWIISLLIILFFYTTFKIIKDIKTGFIRFIRRLSEINIRKLFK